MHWPYITDSVVYPPSGSKANVQDIRSFTHATYAPSGARPTFHQCSICKKKFLKVQTLSPPSSITVLSSFYHWLLLQGFCRGEKGKVETYHFLQASHLTSTLETRNLCERFILCISGQQSVHIYYGRKWRNYFQFECAHIPYAVCGGAVPKVGMPCARVSC